VWWLVEEGLCCGLNEEEGFGDAGWRLWERRLSRSDQMGRPGRVERVDKEKRVDLTGTDWHADVRQMTGVWTTSVGGGEGKVCACEI